MSLRRVTVRAWRRHRRPVDSLRQKGVPVCSLHDSGPRKSRHFGSLLTGGRAMLEPFMATKRVRTNAASTVPPAVDWRGIETRRVEHAAGAGIFAQGDAATSVMYIERGSVRLSVVSPAGKEAVVAVLGPADILRGGLSRRSAGPDGDRDGHDRLHRAGRRQERDGPAAARPAGVLRSVPRPHAGPQHPRRGGPGRPAVQLEREAAGTDPAAPGALRRPAAGAGAAAPGCRRSCWPRWSARRARG